MVSSSLEFARVFSSYFVSSLVFLSFLKCSRVFLIVCVFPSSLEFSSDFEHARSRAGLLWADFGFPLGPLEFPRSPFGCLLDRFGSLRNALGLPL